MNDWNATAMAAAARASVPAIAGAYLPAAAPVAVRNAATAPYAIRLRAAEAAAPASVARSRYRSSLR